MDLACCINYPKGYAKALLNNYGFGTVFITPGYYRDTIAIVKLSPIVSRSEHASNDANTRTLNLKIASRVMRTRERCI